jgi:DNA-3-methyladenine glycosylase
MAKDAIIVQIIARSYLRIVQNLIALPRDFYKKSPIVVGRDLIGKSLFRRLSNGKILSGVIVEAEAYGGTRDPASHAFKGLTKRTKVMFGEVGRTYVYFTYGFHHCLNVVAKSTFYQAGAVLIRAMEPIDGIEIMRINRKMEKGSHPVSSLTNGPGKICQALAIDSSLNGIDVTDPTAPIFISNVFSEIPRKVRKSPRIGITVATEKNWRFYDAKSEFVSRPKINLPEIG